MIDFLLKTEQDDKRRMRQSMSEMIFCRDDNGLNVLATYFKTDLGIDYLFLRYRVFNKFQILVSIS